jgi:hypothetical protein
VEGKGDAADMNYEKDAYYSEAPTRRLPVDPKTRIYGEPERPTRVYPEAPTRRFTEPAQPAAPARAPRSSGSSGTNSPAAFVQATGEMYDLVRRIQDDVSLAQPVEEELGEVYERTHVVHDKNLLLGMRLTAGVGGVTCWLTQFHLGCLVITAVAVLFWIYNETGVEYLKKSR